MPVRMTIGGVYWADVNVVVPPVRPLTVTLPPKAVSMVVKLAFTGTSQVLTLLPLAGVFRPLFVVVMTYLKSPAALHRAP